MKTFVTFTLNNQLFGIEILYVREINKQLDITPVQHAPKYISGLLNLRGQIVTVMDLNQRLNHFATQITPASCNIILKTEAELAHIRKRQGRNDLISVPDSVGFLVDGIDEIVTVEDGDLAPLPPNTDEVESRYLAGVAKQDTRLLAILSTPKVLEYDNKNSPIVSATEKRTP